MSIYAASVFPRWSTEAALLDWFVVGVAGGAVLGASVDWVRGVPGNGIGWQRKGMLLGAALSVVAAIALGMLAAFGPTQGEVYAVALTLIVVTLLVGGVPTRFGRRPWPWGERRKALDRLAAHNFDDLTPEVRAGLLRPRTADDYRAGGRRAT